MPNAAFLDADTTFAVEFCLQYLMPEGPEPDLGLQGVSKTRSLPVDLHPNQDL